MFCGECGTKNKKEALFCEECGAKLREVEEQEESKNTEENGEKITRNRKPMSKKNKIILAIVAIFLVSGYFGYKQLEKGASPEVVVEKYLTAVNNQDFDTIYEMVGGSTSSDFITKDTYKEALSKKITEKDMLGVASVTGSSLTNGGLNATVKVSSSKVNDLSSLVGSDKSLSITLEKTNNRKNIFFKEWKIADNGLFDIDTIDNFYIKVPKDSKVLFNNIELKDNYVDTTKNSDKETNTTYYKLPKVLKSEVDIEITLLDNMKITDKVTPSSYGYVTHVAKSDFSDELKKQLEDQMQKDFNLLLTNILATKDFSEIKSNFASSVKLDDLEDTYTKSVRYRKDNSNTVNSVSMTEGSISSININDSYLYAVENYVYYTYNTNSYWNDEPYDYKQSGYYTFYYTYENGSYKLANISSLPRF